MLIVDKDPRDNIDSDLNARMAAINGFSIFGKNHCYALDNEGEVNHKKIEIFLKNYGSNNFFIFGFTSIIYESLILNSKKYDFSYGNLLHGVGWKKLNKFKINNKEFKKRLSKIHNLKNIFNYYGMIEQTGSVFLECKCGYFITAIFSNVLIRDNNLNILEKNQKGIVKLI